MAISIIVNNSRSPKNAGFLLAPVGKKLFPTPAERLPRALLVWVASKVDIRIF